MTKFQDKRFSVSMGESDYGDNWERTFGKKEEAAPMPVTGRWEEGVRIVPEVDPVGDPLAYIRLHWAAYEMRLPLTLLVALRELVKE